MICIKLHNNIKTLKKLKNGFVTSVPKNLRFSDHFSTPATRCFENIGPNMVMRRGRTSIAVGYYRRLDLSVSFRISHVHVTNPLMFG